MRKWESKQEPPLKTRRMGKEPYTKAGNGIAGLFSIYAAIQNIIKSTSKLITQIDS
jgi:hypothetical protein